MLQSAKLLQLLRIFRAHQRLVTGTLPLSSMMAFESHISLSADVMANRVRSGWVSVWAPNSISYRCISLISLQLSIERPDISGKRPELLPFLFPPTVRKTVAEKP